MLDIYRIVNHYFSLTIQALLANLYIMVHPGERIKCERQKRGWTLRELEKRTGVSNPFLSQIEGGSNFSVERLVLIAKAFGVKASILLGEK